MENINFTIVQLNTSHLASLCRLYKVIFNKNVTPDYFQIKYGLTETEISNYSHTLLINNKVVGFFGVRIINYQRGEEVVHVPQTSDYFILKEFRGGGLFQQLYERVVQVLKSNNYFIVAAFQSEQTYKISERLGWKDTEHLQRFQINSSPKFIGKILKTIGLNNWRFERFKKEIEPFISNFNLTKLNQVENKFCAIYDSHFYKTKEFVEHFQITISGCTVWLKWQGNVSIGFIHFNEDANILDFIQTFKLLAKKAAIHETVIHIQVNSNESKLLSKYILPQPSFKVSTLLLNSTAEFEFKDVKLNLMEMDIF